MPYSPHYPKEFENRDDSDFGALNKDRVAVRKAELAALFAQVKALHADAETVQSHSWLYNKVVPLVGCGQVLHAAR